MGINETAQCSGRKVRRIDDILSDEPIIPINHHCENISHGFVDGARLAQVLKVCGVFDDAVGHFMGSDIEATCKRSKRYVPITIGHDLPVPIGVIHWAAILGNVDDAEDCPTISIERIPPMRSAVVLVGEACVHMRRDSSWVAPGVRRGCDVRDILEIGIIR